MDCLPGLGGPPEFRHLKEGVILVCWLLSTAGQRLWSQGFGQCEDRMGTRAAQEWRGASSAHCSLPPHSASGVTLATRLPFLPLAGGGVVRAPHVVRPW